MTVRDHGAGISEQDMAHIFEPFFSTKKQGTGLGLAMVRGILTQHAGTVEIRSTVGMGTSVSLVWPRGEVESAPAQAQGDGGPADARRSTHRIFKQTQRIILQSKRQPAEAHFLVYVIDDDDLVRDGLCSLLEHLGHRTKSYRYPEVALQELIAAPTPPEVVIVDYNMPGMNGAQFIGGYSTAVAKRHALRPHLHPADERAAAEPFSGFHVRVRATEAGHPRKAVQPGDAAQEARQYPGHAKVVRHLADGAPQCGPRAAACRRGSDSES